MYDDDESRTLVQRRDELLAKAAAQARQPTLVMLTGPNAGRVYRLQLGSSSIGRSYSQDLTLDEEGVSRAHAVLITDALGGALIEDNKSTNGTRVNDQLVGPAPSPVREGDRIQLGTNVVLKFTWADALEEEVQQRLYDNAVRDALTHTWNRRYFNERLAQEFSFAHRHQRPLSLLVIDLDHFKQVNDRFGHAAGDQVLRAIAARVQTDLRDEDVLARFGGEEFTVLLRDCLLVDAMAVAERIRRRVASTPVPFEGRPVPVTISVGVACTAEEQMDSSQRLFSRADQRLYKAKREGRNRVVGQ